MNTLLQNLLNGTAMVLRAQPNEGSGAGDAGSAGDDDVGGDTGGGAAAGGAGDAGDSGGDAGAGDGDKGGEGDGKGDKGGETNGADTTKEFPEEWRQRLAGEDKSDLKSLNRYNNPEEMWKAFKQQTRQISERGLSRPKEGASDEEWATWREQSNIPSKAEDFKIELGDDKQIGDDDKPIIDSLIDYSLKNDLNLTNDQMSKLCNWYYSGLLEQSANAVIEADDVQKSDTLKILTEEWGSDYRGNVSRGGLVQKDASEEYVEMMKTARDGQGRIISQTPEYKREQARLSRMIFPADIPIGGDIDASIKDLTSRRAAIETLMGDKNSEYWKGAAANQMQSEYRDIVDSMQRLKA